MKQNLYILALLGVASAIKKTNNAKFAVGDDDYAEHGVALKIKTDTLQTFNYAQLDKDEKKTEEPAAKSRPAGPVRGEKGW